MKLLARFLMVLLLILNSAAIAAKTRVVIWDEQQPQQKEAYDAFLGQILAKSLEAREDLSVKSVSINDANKGLSDELLDNCDVLIWWGHVRNSEVTEAEAMKIVNRIKQGKLSMIALHSAHWATPFVMAMHEKTKLEALKLLPKDRRRTAKVEWTTNFVRRAPKRDAVLTPSVKIAKTADGKTLLQISRPNCCFPAYRNDGKPSTLTTLMPDHPVARGIPKTWTLPHTEMYDEPFHVPEPEAVIFEEKWESGERFRSGSVWQLGKGKVFYFRPGHETFSVYTEPMPLRVISNAVSWLGQDLTNQRSATKKGFVENNAEDGFQPMLNGKDLTGWVLTNTPAETWSFKDDLLICSGKPIGEMRTAEMYQNFIMEVEWRHMKPKGNAGIFIWADDITARGQPFHRGIEVQVLEDAYGNGRGHTVHGDIFPIHGAKMIPINGRGGSRAFPTENRSKPSPQWNHYRIECNDGNISLAVNGKVVTRGTKCWPKKGYICIESEGGIVHYRNMKIKVLPNTPIDVADVAISNRGFRSLYSGLDLSGWKVADQSAWKSKDWVLGHSGDKDSPSSITTGTPYGNFGFVFDIQLKNEDSKVSVKLRDSNVARIDLADTAVKNALEKTGRWNRFEGEIRGERLTLTVNGQTVHTNKQLPGVNANGPIEFTATGNVDFANIYIRK